MAQSSGTGLPPARRAAAPARHSARPFFGLLDSVIVRSPTEFAFEGAIGADEAAAAWNWLIRDVAADLIDPEVTEAEPGAVAALEALIPELLQRARDALAAAATSRELERRIRARLPDERAWTRLPIILTALKCRTALEKAQSFGRAANGTHEDAEMALGLQSLPLADRPVAALLLHVIVGQVAIPSRLITAATRLAGGATESDLLRAGYGGLVEAMLAHAQDQIPLVTQVGTFADADLMCRAIDRFHRLSRAINYVDIGRHGRWAGILAALTKTISERIEPKLRDVAPDVNTALRRARDGADRYDSDQMLAALNGMFLLSTIRECRDSLALNLVFDQVWTQVGQSLEVHIERNLDLIRRDASDRSAASRLDGGIKMAELRFGGEYADILRRARGGAERRLAG
jgi:hypothetical protein